MDSVQRGLVFGVFPLGLAGGPQGIASGPPDDLEQIGRALLALQGDGAPLLIRWYVVWTGAASTDGLLGHVAQVVSTGAALDLVLCYRDPSGNVSAWVEFVASVVTRHGHQLTSVQVTGEANLVGVEAAADGSTPRAVEALVAGVRAADEARNRLAGAASVGFAVVPETDPAAGAFWPALAKLGGPDFVDCLDYVGLDMYPDVFGEPIEPIHMKESVERLLRRFRETALPIAGIGAAIPIRICETGWPTGPGRSELRQAEVLLTVLHAVHDARIDLNITHWELFTLRDADSSRDDIFHQFGVLRDDYSPKLVFEPLCALLSELRQ